MERVSTGVVIVDDDLDDVVFHEDESVGIHAIDGRITRCEAA